MGYEMNDKNTSVRDVCTQCVLKWFEAEKHQISVQERFFILFILRG